jgi:hypothetical protein
MSPVAESALVGSATLAAIQPVAFPADTLLFRAGDVGDRLTSLYPAGLPSSKHAMCPISVYWKCAAPASSSAR